jgi:hypothetical protein
MEHDRRDPIMSTDAANSTTTTEKTTTPIEKRGYGAYNCYVCRQEKNAAGILFHDTLATIRIFTGVPGQGQSLAGGYAACTQHAHVALAQALRPMLSLEGARRCPPKNWQVIGFAVERGKLDQPRLGKRLFVMRERLFDEPRDVVSSSSRRDA